MSDLRKPGNPGGSRGHSLPQKNQSPLASGNDGSADKATAAGSRIATPVTPGKTSGRKGNPVR